MGKYLDLTGLAAFWAAVKSHVTTAVTAAKPKRFTSVSVATTAWASNSTYSEYAYRAAVALTGVTSDMTPDVVFAPTEAGGGNFAPVAACYTGGVYLYARAKPTATVTIPTILCFPSV